MIVQHVQDAAADGFCFICVDISGLLHADVLFAIDVFSHRCRDLGWGSASTLEEHLFQPASRWLANLKAFYMMSH